MRNEEGTFIKNTLVATTKALRRQEKKEKILFKWTH